MVMINLKKNKSCYFHVVISIKTLIIHSLSIYHRTKFSQGLLFDEITYEYLLEY